jgi:hypothetical protein
MNIDITQSRKDAIENNVRFQPVIVVLHNQKPNRLECHCGAMATFITVELDEDGLLGSVCVECHDCYGKAEEDEE